MTSTAFYPRNKSYGDKAFQYNSNRKTNNYEVRVSANFFQAKSSQRYYNSKPAWYGDSYEYSYQPAAKRDNQFDSMESNWKQKQYNIKKGSNSPASTMASEGDLENEISGFKVVQSGKVLIDGQQSSDSDSIFSPAETEKQTPSKEEFRFASATKFLGPNPQAISMPSFL
eukprot:CAMPEP_0176424192 /NCGR_PEP_ID=MMETSP0127-20121128/10702_1 /TAXON_ID=938130 /ORGANISM="Platyophrya macrostoma, Strain WH" /LENGTH=169 /DNA_ID=CAMNT_0017805225 /DNA_START=45 /DNA_END=554 /DNA_ORIENTATION=-